MMPEDQLRFDGEAHWAKVLGACRAFGFEPG
jgi:hypothetical protein